MKELKVGDRVAVYNQAVRFVGEVLTVSGDLILVKNKDNFRFDYHRKQVRLLTKKKRREWWIRPTMIAGQYDHWRPGIWKEKPDPEDMTGVFHVREVVKK